MSTFEFLPPETDLDKQVGTLRSTWYARVTRGLDPKIRWESADYMHSYFAVALLDEDQDPKLLRPQDLRYLPWHLVRLSLAGNGRTFVNCFRVDYLQATPMLTVTDHEIEIPGPGVAQLAEEVVIISELQYEAGASQPEPIDYANFENAILDLKTSNQASQPIRLY